MFLARHHIDISVIQWSFLPTTVQWWWWIEHWEKACSPALLTLLTKIIYLTGIWLATFRGRHVIWKAFGLEVLGWEVYHSLIMSRERLIPTNLLYPSALRISFILIHQNVSGPPCKKGETECLHPLRSVGYLDTYKPSQTNCPITEQKLCEKKTIFRKYRTLLPFHGLLSTIYNDRCI